mgnify:FL=1
MKGHLWLGMVASGITLMYLCACAPSDPIEASPTLGPARQPTRAPDPIETPALLLDPTHEFMQRCTGWICSLEGVVYANEATPGNELAGVTVLLQQVSWCSPTSGEHETVTDSDGRFGFEVYLHDTDTFWIEIALEGYQPLRQAMGGFDCLFCGCDPMEILLIPVE